MSSTRQTYITNTKEIEGKVLKLSIKEISDLQS